MNPDILVTALVGIVGVAGTVWATWFQDRRSQQRLRLEQKRRLYSEYLNELSALQLRLIRYASFRKTLDPLGPGEAHRRATQEVGRFDVDGIASSLSRLNNELALIGDVNEVVALSAPTEALLVQGLMMINNSPEARWDDRSEFDFFADLIREYMVADLAGTLPELRKHFREHPKRLSKPPSDLLVRLGWGSSKHSESGDFEPGRAVGIDGQRAEVEAAHGSVADYAADRRGSTQARVSGRTLTG